MELEVLKDKIMNKLSNGAKSIPALSKATKADEYSVLVAIAALEDSDMIVLSGFDQMYREDGGAIYLAQYKKKVSNS
jgi:hypothetical protein